MCEIDNGHFLRQLRILDVPFCFRLGTSASNTLPLHEEKHRDTVMPLIPYFQIPVIHIPLPFQIAGFDHIPIHGFGILVATGFLLGGWLAMRRAERIGLDKSGSTN